MAIIKRPQKIKNKLEKGRETELSSLRDVGVIVKVSWGKAKITLLWTHSSSWYTMKTLDLNKHVIHMLMRFPDERESSVTDVG